MRIAKFLRRMKRHADSTPRPRQTDHLTAEPLEQRLLLSAQYALVDIGTLGGNFGVARSINDAGQVVGHAEAVPDSGLWRAFLWEDGAMEMLPTHLESGSTQSYAYDINASGDISGALNTATNRWNAYTYDGTAVSNIHPGSDTSYSYARAINDSGVVAGISSPDGEDLRAIKYHPATGTQNIAVTKSAAYDINNAGTIVGKSLVLTDYGYYYHAAVWAGGSPTDIDSSNTFNSEAYAINSAGQVVGWMDNWPDDELAFIWDATNGIQGLGTLGGDASTAWDINDAGQVVGWAENDDYVPHAFIYQDGVLEDLNDLVDPTDMAGWSYLNTAYAINNDGWIVGSGVKTGASYYQPFLLRPLEAEAPTAAAIASGVTEPGETSYQFLVAYSDNVAVDVATIGAGDVKVTGPGGFEADATFVSLDNDTNGTPRAATYEIEPPGGAWDEGDNGTFNVVVQAGQVADVDGNFVTTGTVGGFEVLVTSGGPAESGPAVFWHQPTVLAAGTLDHVDVTFDKTIDGATFTTADVSLTGPAGSVGITGVSFLSGLTYRVNVSPVSDAGTYTLSVGPQH